MVSTDVLDCVNSSFMYIFKSSRFEYQNSLLLNFTIDIILFRNFCQLKYLKLEM